MADCELIGTLKHRSVSRSIAFQQLKTYIILFPFVPHALRSMYSGVSVPVVRSDLVIDASGVNVCFGLSSSYVCLIVKRDQNASMRDDTRLMYVLDAALYLLKDLTMSLSSSQVLCPAKSFDCIHFLLKNNWGISSCLSSASRILGSALR